MQLLKRNILLVLSIFMMLASSYQVSSAITPIQTEQQHVHLQTSQQHVCDDLQMHCQQLVQSDCYSACTNIPYFLSLTSFSHQVSTGLALFHALKIGVVVRRLQSILRPPTW